jgi:pimeloyl-ACP methyl ester carboxylesterase
MMRWLRRLANLALAAAVLVPLRAAATLAPLTVSPTTTFTVGMLRVERFGNPAGRPIIFIPALYCGPWEWNAQIDSLSTGYDLYVLTLPGFDGRPMVSGDSLLRRAARDLHLLISSRRLVHPTVVGHSLGGTLAVLFSETYPSDVANVVTVEGGHPIASTQKLRDDRTESAVRPFVGISRAAFGPALVKYQLQYVITSKADVAAMERLAARSDPAAIVAWLRAALPLDLTPGLHSVTATFTAIIPYDATIDPFNGFPSESAKRAAYERWVANTPHGSVVVIAPSRHFVMFDRPKAFAEAVRAAIRR